MIRETGFRKGDDFYVALGGGKISAKTIVNKIMQRLKGGEAVAGDETEARLASVLEGRDERQRRTQEASDYGIEVQGARRRHGAAGEVLPSRARRPDRGLRVAGARHHDPPRGLQEREGPPRRRPSGSPTSSWEGGNEASYRVELEIDAWDRARLLEDLSRSFSESGVNIIEARCSTKHPMVKNRFVVEVGDSDQLRQCVSRLRHVEGVFDAYRVTPSA